MLNVDEMVLKSATHTGVAKKTIYKIIREEVVVGEVLEPKKSLGRPNV